MSKFVFRCLSLVFGSLLFAVGVVLAINANIGYAPWEVFHVGLSLTTGLSLGLVSIIAGSVIVVIVTLCGETIGFGTIISMILTGTFIDLLMLLNIIPKSDKPAIGIFMLVAGLFVSSIGSYFYMNSAFGVGPRDNLMVVLKRKTKLPIGVCRSSVELFVMLIGWLLGGMVWIGTAISVVAMGFCIQLTFAAFRFDPTKVNHETFGRTYRALAEIRSARKRRR